MAEPLIACSIDHASHLDRQLALAFGDPECEATLLGARYVRVGCHVASHFLEKGRGLGPDFLIRC